MATLLRQLIIKVAAKLASLQSGPSFHRIANGGRTVIAEQNSFQKVHAETVAPTFWQMYKGRLWDATKGFLVFQAARISLIGVAAMTGEGRLLPETRNVIVIGAAMVAIMYYGNLKMKSEAKQRNSC
jgi:hypothetical protein